MEQQELIFNPGLIVNDKFYDYKIMQEGAKNWLLLTKYRFSKGSFYGCINGIQLNNLQLGHIQYDEGMLFEGYSPKDCITIGVIQENFGQICINNQKMNLHDILIIDDTKPYDFVSSAHTKMAVISIKKSILLKDIPHILSMKDIRLKDVNNTLSKAIEKEWLLSMHYKRNPHNETELSAMEERIISILSIVLKKNFLDAVPLTNGEKTSIQIKSFLLNSLKKNISVSEVSREFLISEKTFQNSFKSLYGMTPKYFIQMLKLNRVHEDLQHFNSQTINISQIAMKWGFKHFGRFSQSYKEVFGVLPSETIKIGSTK